MVHGGHCYQRHLFFAAFDARTTSARELLRQVRADRFKAANPKLEIAATVTGTADPPKVLFQFVDESEVSCSFTSGHISQR
jgi:cytochrome c1